MIFFWLRLAYFILIDYFCINKSANIKAVKSAVQYI